ncbi:hypothetical protein BHE74_00038989 [Ensete ventricosum]|nr:hypothetical protein BHE74_00038989 [Ensete ventricosum]RZS16325.1 hypothetical protein BHM03_00048318 [Ensete ventricosum]
MVAAIERSAAADREGDSTLIALDNTGIEDDSARSTGRGRMATWKREGQQVLAALLSLSMEKRKHEGSNSSGRGNDDGNAGAT